ncbi:hypothetical protein NOF04DRAFT_5861 [Fusarium oxysporum II5]|uniref:Infection structure specific protein n=3 Tax=Fusarium oxysporum species complex TaxID=171631 RepID=N1S1M5_FUSC4|nr:uncharacterized protein FOIG_09140 [Fusarium odoratissimum NRRL 54006]EMT70407.1 hypothetical protein FOC4_g10008854 [Fusarium odoratissimum]KAH7203445.1 hypothetical protein DER44DRAFT_779415 [Fusarium oxysporum]KAK2130495.1 hypothetical protein NOF04DRAFT_5861 [Fusarium oxysporum II5]TXC00533.1 hypothetical protein FocTR4_00009426 [Fusarium oxysporum f. sp. cubense]EXL99278.1 hypothetical protein FOIG_09140 [Fusarium odoratissimum NRRL 54006]
MYTSIILLLTAFSAHAAAQTLTPTAAPTITTSRPSLTLPSCWALEDSLSMTGAPAPPMDMSELGVSFALGSLYNTQDPCKLPVITGSSAEEFSEWASEWTSWQAEHVSEYRVVWEACSDDPAITDLVPVGPDACSTLKAKITGTSAANEDKDEDREKEEGRKDDKPEAVDGSPGSRMTASLAVALMAGGVLVAGLW